MRLASLASLASLVVAGEPQDGNCGVPIPRVPNAPDQRLQELVLGDPDAMDLEDQLFSENPDDWEHIRYNCAQGDGERCRTFGVEHWNLTSFYYNFATSQQGTPCPEDFAIVPESCGGRIACHRINGRLRIVALEIDEDDAVVTVAKLPALPHLFAVLLHGASKEMMKGVSAAPSLQLLRLEQPEPGALEALRPGGSLQSVQIHGRQDQLHWTPVDLSALCGFNLMYFNAYAINVVGGTVPDCWRKMRNLRTFYCSNCMMHRVPTGLQGLTQLKSFVAFRQWELVPCALQHVKDSSCKVSWETLHGTKGEAGLKDSSGQWEDFQEGPSFICPHASYAFDFEEFLKLGWSNIRKVWLDGNFLTGTIPANIHSTWPKLESLDLYDNNLEGPIPDGLGKLPFVKLQLQGNRFSGQVPKSVLDLTKRPNIVLGLQENPDLEGCAPDVAHWKDGIPGTRIRRCDGEL